MINYFLIEYFLEVAESEGFIRIAFFTYFKISSNLSKARYLGLHKAFTL